MSYILEALKKAQAERQLGNAPTIHAPALVPPAPAATNANRKPLLIGLGAGALVVAVAGVAAWRQQVAAPASPPVVFAASAPAAPQTTPASSTVGLAAPAPAAQQTTPVSSAVGPAAPAPAPTAQQTTPASSTVGLAATAPTVQQTTPAVVPEAAPLPAPAPAVSLKSVARPAPAPAPVRGPASQAAPAAIPEPALRPMPATLPKTAVAQALPRPLPDTAAGQANAGARPGASAGRGAGTAAVTTAPAPSRTAAHGGSAQQAEADPAVYEAVRNLQALPEVIQREVPKVVFGGYIYSQNPADRLLLVDKTLRREGEEVAPGLVLERLLPKAAVMNYRGYRYRVPY